MDILYRKDKRSYFDELALSYIKENNSSCRYTPLFWEYSRFYSKNLIADLSFILLRDKKPVALVFLPLEKWEKQPSISINGSYVQSPLYRDEKIEKEVFNQIDLLAQKNSVAQIKFSLDPLVAGNNFNILRKYGYLDSSSSDSLLNLKLSINKLWHNVRRGHQYDINRIIKNKDFEIVVVDHNKRGFSAHQSYVDLHHRCAGKTTRNKKTFDLQYKMLQNNQAAIFQLKYKTKPVGYCYFFHYKKGVIYASAADDPDFTGFPVYHSLIWKAIEYYKNHGFEYLELCEPCGYRIQFDHYLDEKQKNISRFKRGFGGQMIPLFKGIKYYDKKLFEKDLNNFHDQYLTEI